MHPPDEAALITAPWMSSHGNGGDEDIAAHVSDRSLRPVTINVFLTVHTNTVTHVETFTLNGVAYRLGQVGKSFRTNYSGQSNAPGAPSGWFAGTSIGSRSYPLERVGVESD